MLLQVKGNSSSLTAFEPARGVFSPLQTQTESSSLLGLKLPDHLILQILGFNSLHNSFYPPIHPVLSFSGEPRLIRMSLGMSPNL